MDRKAARRVVPVVAAVGLAVAACGSSGSSAAAGGTSQKPLIPFTFRTEYLASGSDVPYFYGIAAGIYKANGLNFQVNFGTGSLYTIEDVAKGRSQAGDASTGSVILAEGQGEPVVAVGADIERSDIGFFVPKSSHISSISQLGGKTVVTETGAPEDTLLPAVFGLAHVANNSVKRLIVSPALVDSTYASGKGDFLSESIPFGTPQVKARPSTVLPWSNVGFHLPGYSYVVSRSYFANHPKIVAAFLKATYEADLRAEAHPQAAIDAFMNANPTLNRNTTMEQWTLWSQLFCSANQVSAGDKFGFNAPPDWADGVSILRHYGGLTNSQAATAYYTNKMFEPPYSVSSTKCTN